MLVTTLVDNDELGHPRILEIVKNEQGNQVMSIVVHWYHTSSPYAFTGKYSLEMVKDGRSMSRKRRRKNIPSMSTLTLDNVDILLYEFSLTKTDHLRLTTIRILKEKIPKVSLEMTKRQTTSMSHNHGDFGLQLDEDNALVANDEEDETSQSSFSSSNRSENDGISL